MHGHVGRNATCNIPDTRLQATLWDQRLGQTTKCTQQASPTRSPKPTTTTSCLRSPSSERVMAPHADGEAPPQHPSDTSAPPRSSQHQVGVCVECHEPPPGPKPACFDTRGFRHIFFLLSVAHGTSPMSHAESPDPVAAKGDRARLGKLVRVLSADVRANSNSAGIKAGHWRPRMRRVSLVASCLCRAKRYNCENSAEDGGTARVPTPEPRQRPSGPRRRIPPRCLTARRLPSVPPPAFRRTRRRMAAIHDPFLCIRARMICVRLGGVCASWGDARGWPQGREIVVCPGRNPARLGQLRCSLSLLLGICTYGDVGGPRVRRHGASRALITANTRAGEAGVRPPAPERHRRTI